MKLDSSVILVYGDPGHGKSALVTLLSADYEKNRIYGNMSIFYNGEEISQRINSVSIFEHIPFNVNPGLVIVDEIGANFNSKNATSDRNKKFSSFIFKQRKKNLSTIGIAQRLGSIPVDLREIATHVFEVKKYYEPGNPKPLFNIYYQELDPKENYMVGITKKVVKFDILGALEELGYSYNTLDDSFIED